MIIVEVTQTTPVTPLGPPVRPEPGEPLRLTLTGVDGSTWDLSNGPVHVLSGITGLGTAKPEHRWKDSPAIDGSTWGGSRTPQRNVILPVKIEAKKALPFRDIEDAFFTAIDPAGECELTVTTPDGRQRLIRMRYDDGADAEFEDDPLLMTRSRYALSFIAADPYWHGEPIVRQYKLGALQPLFPGPPFNINPSNVLGSATVTNPGDVPSWPVWKVEGPFSGFKVSLGDAVVEYVGSVPEGESITVDMHPRQLTIRNQDGNDRWVNATDVKFAEVPPGTDLPMDLSLTGANASTLITLQFTPRHKRAW